MTTFSESLFFPKTTLDNNPFNMDFNSNIEPPPFSQLDVAGLVCLAVARQRRGPKQRCDRFDFNKHVWLQSNANMFQCHHHMTPKSFVKLVSLPSPNLRVNEQKAANGGGITPIENVVGMGPAT